MFSVTSLVPGLWFITNGERRAALLGNSCSQNKTENLNPTSNERCPTLSEKISAIKDTGESSFNDAEIRTVSPYDNIIHVEERRGDTDLLQFRETPEEICGRDAPAAATQVVLHGQQLARHSRGAIGTDEGIAIRSPQQETKLAGDNTRDMKSRTLEKILGRKYRKVDVEMSCEGDPSGPQHPAHKETIF